MADARGYPYTAICVVFVDFGGQGYRGSGVLISPDEVLTASHLVNLTTLGQGSNFMVYPGYQPGDNPPFGVDATATHFFQVGTPDGLLSVDDIQHDYALLHLSQPVVGTGVMGVRGDFPGGLAHVSGYPASAGYQQIDSLQQIENPPGYSLFLDSSLGGGSSGGPVWVASPGHIDAVGVNSAEDSAGTGYATQFTAASVQQILSWVQQDDGNHPLVDANYYYAANPDVAFAGYNATAHYQAHGWLEGRDPDAYFSTSGYVAAIGQSGVDPARQYDEIGWRENHNPSAGFNTRLYLQDNPDVAAAGLDPLAHYLSFGRFEGRPVFAAIGPATQIVAGFDREYYLLANPDVARSGIDALQHYLRNGWHEGRKADAVFDPSYYLAHNPDVAVAGVDPLTHYNNFGWHEGRDPSADFSTLAYSAHAPDVVAAGINPLEHYLQSGVFEGRPVA